MSDDLRDRLRAAVPEPPAARDRAAAARQRARRARRRTTVGVVVGAALVVAALAAVPALTREETRPLPLDVPRPSAGPDVPCSLGLPRGRTIYGEDRVPDGAEVVRLCPGDGGPGLDFKAPRDALATDVGALIEAINDQPEIDTSGGCRLNLGPGYTLVFGYPDGRQQFVTGRLYGCEELRVGGITRANADTIYREFRRLLRAQRAEARAAVDAGSSAEDVVAAYGARLAAGDGEGAAALWSPLAGPGGERTPCTGFDVRAGSARAMPTISAWRDATSVAARCAVETPYGEDEAWREARFLLGRDEDGVFRIVHLQVGDRLRTGR